MSVRGQATDSRNVVNFLQFRQRTGARRQRGQRGLLRQPRLLVLPRRVRLVQATHPRRGRRVDTAEGTAAVAKPAAAQSCRGRGNRTRVRVIVVVCAPRVREVVRAGPDIGQRGLVPQALVKHRAVLDERGGAATGPKRGRRTLFRQFQLRWKRWNLGGIGGSKAGARERWATEGGVES